MLLTVTRRVENSLPAALSGSTRGLAGEGYPQLDLAGLESCRKWVQAGGMDQVVFPITRAPAALAPARRLVQPTLLTLPQEPLLPWPVPEPAVPEDCPIPTSVQRVVGQLTAAVVEVLRGQRPLEHLAGHAVPDVHELVGHLRRASPLLQLRLESLRLCQPAHGVVEVAARLSLGARYRAAALRYVSPAETSDRGLLWRLANLELALEPSVIVRAG